MKQEEIGNNVERSGEFKASKFGIKNAADMVHIFSVLRSKLYSDKVLAVCREYATNACDAHIDAGVPDKPIKITLPNWADPQFKVRDFGKGLDEDGIREVYCMYGASTKRNSNAFNGQMGFGSKSAFAYTDFWQINSHCNGERISYSVFLDESGLGEVSELSRAASEETGIEIVIPVDRSDIPAFHRCASQLYRWFRITPEIVGADVDIRPPQISIDLGEVKVTAGRMDDAIAVMGNVGYPIDISKFMFDRYAHPDVKQDNKLNLKDSEWVRWRGNNLVMYFDIGELQMAASREALEYKDSTVKAIIKKLTGISDRAVEMVKKEVAKETNLRAAFDKVAALNFISSEGMSVILQNQKIKWGGRDWDEHPTIDDHYFSSCVEVFRSGTRFAARPIDILNKERISPVTNVIALLDTDRAIGVARAKQLAADTRKSVSLLVPAPTKIEETKKWLENNIPADLWHLISTCADPVLPDSSEEDDRPLVRQRKAPTKVDAAKRAAIYLAPSLGEHEKSAKSKNWSPATLDATKYNLVVQIESFAPIGFTDSSIEPRKIANSVKDLITAGVLPQNTVVLGVRTADLKGAMDDGCLMLSDVLRKTAESLSEECALHDAIVALGNNQKLLVCAKNAGVPLLFDPEDSSGKQASAKMRKLAESYIGRNLRIFQMSNEQRGPLDAVQALHTMFPLIKGLNMWDLDRQFSGKELTKYMSLSLAARNQV